MVSQEKTFNKKTIKGYVSAANKSTDHGNDYVKDIFLYVSNDLYTSCMARISPYQKFAELLPRIRRTFQQ
jgi:hypothetical protein